MGCFACGCFADLREVLFRLLIWLCYWLLFVLLCCLVGLFVVYFGLFVGFPRLLGFDLLVYVLGYLLCGIRVVVLIVLCRLPLFG